MLDHKLRHNRYRIFTHIHAQLIQFYIYLFSPFWNLFMRKIHLDEMTFTFDVLFTRSYALHSNNELYSFRIIFNHLFLADLSSASYIIFGSLSKSFVAMFAIWYCFFRCFGVLIMLDLSRAHLLFSDCNSPMSVLFYLYYCLIFFLQLHLILFTIRPASLITYVFWYF